jgi:hypothetical protein
MVCTYHAVREMRLWGFQPNLVYLPSVYRTPVAAEVEEGVEEDNSFAGIAGKSVTHVLYFLSQSISFRPH